MIDHEKIHRYLIWLANQVTLDEDVDYLLKEKLKRFHMSLASQISWDNLTVEDVKTLGFLYYDDESAEDYDLYLIPAYLHAVIPEGVTLQTIHGESFQYDPLHTPYSTFYGFMAYGVLIKSTNKEISKECLKT